MVLIPANYMFKWYFIAITRTERSEYITIFKSSFLQIYIDILSWLYSINMAKENKENPTSVDSKYKSFEIHILWGYGHYHIMLTCALVLLFIMKI